MNWKKIFKPTMGKIVIFLILMGGLNYFIISFIGAPIDARALVGVPLGFYPMGSFFCPTNTVCVPPPVEFSWVNLIIDIIFWYLVSCLIVWLYDKVKKK